MSREQLSHLLSDMADEAKPASVHHQAIAQSRRGSTMRATVAGIAALAILGGGAAGAAGLYQSDSTNTPAASDSGKIDGTFIDAYFTNPDPDKVFSWQPGDDEPEQFAQLEEDGLYDSTGSVSPDGKNIAYIASEDGESGVIKVADMESGETKELADFSREDTCNEPVWAPDGQRVFIDRGAEYDEERFGFVDIETQEFSPSAQPSGCDVQVTTDENGEDLLYSMDESDNGLEVYETTADGETNVTGIADAVGDAAVRADSEFTYVQELSAVSPDGRYACVKTNSEIDDMAMDLYRTGCDLVVDLEYIDVVDLSFDGDKDMEGDFLSAGQSVFAIPDHFLMKAHIGDERPVWQLYDESGKLVDEQESIIEGDDGMGWGDVTSLQFVPNSD